MPRLLLRSLQSASLWDALFASAFSLRCSELVRESFARFRFHETIEHTLDHWQDEDAQQPSQQRTDASAEMWSGLRQSAVSALASSFSAQLTGLAADVRHLLHCPVADCVRAALTQQSHGGTSAGRPPPPSVSSSRWPHDFLPLLSLPRFLDEELLPSLHRLYGASVQSLAEQLKKRLSLLEHGVLSSMSTAEGWRSDDCARLVQQAVFIGRCCHQITRQAQEDKADPLGPPSSASPPSSLSLSTVAISSALSSTTRSAFRIWSRYVAATLSEEMEGQLSRWMEQLKAVQADASAQQRSAQRRAVQRLERTFLHSQAAEQTQSHERSDPRQSRPSASSVAPSSSSDAAAALPFPVPGQPSPFVFRFLFSVQERLYSTHGYGVQADVLQWLLADVGGAVLNVWDSLSLPLGEEQQPQPQPLLAALPFSALLQAEFDLRFLFGLLRLPQPTQARPAPSTATTAGGKATAAAPPQYSSDGRAQLAQLLALLEKAQSRRPAAPAGALSAADWTLSRAALVQAVTAAVQRSHLLLGLLSRRNPLPAVLGIDERGAAAAATAQSTAALPVMPLATNVPRLLPFSHVVLPEHTAAAASAARRDGRLCVSSERCAAVADGDGGVAECRCDVCDLRGVRHVRAAQGEGEADLGQAGTVLSEHDRNTAHFHTVDSLPGSAWLLG